MEPRYLDFTLYPNVPGSAPIDTSEDAAESMRESAPTLRAKALEVLWQFGPATADEIAAKLGKAVLAIRPRVTELFKMGEIEDTGSRRRNASGRRAVVWMVRQEVA
jgi:predicted ArsR family transcriptional regulator